MKLAGLQAADWFIPETIELVRSCNRQALEHDSMSQCENCSVRTDAQSQCENDHRRESRTLPHLPQRVPHVLQTRIALSSGHALHIHLPWPSPNTTTLLSRGNSRVRSSICPSFALF